MDIYLQTQQSSSLCSLSNCSFWFPLAGTGIPEERAAGARWQVCVGGEPVHHRGQLQLHWCRGLSHRGQRTGESFGLCGFSRKPEGVHVRLSRPDSVAVACRHRHWKLASHFLSMQLFLQALLTPPGTFLGKRPAGEAFRLPAAVPPTLYCAACLSPCVRAKSANRNIGFNIISHCGHQITPANFKMSLYVVQTESQHRSKRRQSKCGFYGD